MGRIFVLFYTGMAIFICDVCARERLISTKYKMKAKMAKRKKKTLGSVSFPGLRSRDVRRTHSKKQLKMQTQKN